MVACPLCHSNLDFQQDAILRERGHDFRIPVLYLTQLIGLALGIAPERSGCSVTSCRCRSDALIPAEEASRV